MENQTPDNGTVQKKEASVDYLEKFKASQREAMGLKAERDALKNRLESVSTPEISDEELKEQYANWDELPDTTKQVFRDKAALEKKVNSLELTTREFMQKTETERELEKVISQDQRIAEKADEFKLYAKKHKGADISVLAKAFVADMPTPEPKQQGVNGLEGGGYNPAPNPEPKPDTSKFKMRMSPKDWVSKLKQG